jgi:hypothetical protein
MRSKGSASPTFCPFQWLATIRRPRSGPALACSAWIAVPVYGKSGCQEFDSGTLGQGPAMGHPTMAYRSSGAWSARSRRFSPTCKKRLRVQPGHAKVVCAEDLVAMVEGTRPVPAPAGATSAIGRRSNEKATARVVFSCDWWRRRQSITPKPHHRAFCAQSIDVGGQSGALRLFRLNFVSQLNSTRNFRSFYSLVKSKKSFWDKN